MSIPSTVHCTVGCESTLAFSLPCRHLFQYLIINDILLPLSLIHPQWHAQDPNTLSPAAVATSSSLTSSGSHYLCGAGESLLTGEMLDAEVFCGTLSGDQAEQFAQSYKRLGDELRTQFQDTRTQLAEKSVEFISPRQFALSTRAAEFRRKNHKRIGDCIPTTAEAAESSARRAAKRSRSASRTNTTSSQAKSLAPTPTASLSKLGSRVMVIDMDAIDTALQNNPLAAVQVAAGPTAGGRPIRPGDSQWEPIDLCELDVEDMQWANDYLRG